MASDSGGDGSGYDSGEWYPRFFAVWHVGLDTVMRQLTSFQDVLGSG
jgi:hypothetical protein